LNSLRPSSPWKKIGHWRRVIQSKLLNHYYLWTRESEKAELTAGVEQLEKLTIDSQNRKLGTHYAPTPYLIIDWLHEILPRDVSGWSFVDYGAGRGRVVMLAAKRPYAQVVGVEFAQELAEQAEKNIRSMKAKDVEAKHVSIAQADATSFQVPDTPLVAYFYAPFSKSVMVEVLSQISADFARNPRPVVLAFLNPPEPEVLVQFPEFHPCRLPLGLRIKIALLSPHPVRIYTTVKTTSVRAQLHLLLIGLSWKGGSSAAEFVEGLPIVV
jgi:16S rRNA G966 N2-methylase RsmD